MNFLNEQVVLDYYIELINSGKIDFLVRRKQYIDTIKAHIAVLRDEPSMNKKIQSAKELWKILFTCSMSYIDPNQKGYDNLFKYFDDYVEFEELIFASDSFYRDHTIHCLWVYFLGVYLKFHGEFADLIKVNHLHETHLKFIKELQRYHTEHQTDASLSIINNVIEILEATQKNDQAVFCVSALTHDLGYPLKKISKINKCIKKVLPSFGIDSFDEFNFNYSAIQQHFNEKFLSILTTSLDHSITTDPFKANDLDEELISALYNVDSTGQGVIDIEKLNAYTHEEKNKVYSIFKFNLSETINYPLELRYSDDLEKYQHGIMSAFLLTKVIDAFRNTEFVINADKTSDNKAPDTNFPRSLIKQAILRAITDHTSTGYRINAISGYSEYLTFIDELEEFSRISRANQNREFINEFCKTNIYRQDKYLMIDFVFDNEDIANLDPELAFRGRCKKMLSLFNIAELDSELKIKLSCIGQLPYDKNHYMIEIRNKFANITINGEDKDIPTYLKSYDYMSRQDYENL